ncbi:MAG: type II secretion system F family protein [Alphaproteobacteria bacterium]|nr:type II secretion system F family protein [Alphaproteobacteria bacterium]
MLTWLPPGLGQDDAIMIGAALAAFISVLVVWQALLLRDPMASRAKALALREAALKAGALAPTRRERGASAKQSSIEFMRRWVKRLNLVRGDAAKHLQVKMARAGLRSRDVVIVFLFMKFTLPVVVAAVAFPILSAIDLSNLPKNMNLILTAVAAAIGMYLPDLYINHITKNRREAIRKAVPDALDLLVICSEAGLTLDAGLERVARESAQGTPELADEFTLTSIELRFLPERRKALENLVERVDLNGIQSLVGALIQTERYGTPLVQALRMLANEMRNERMMRAEEKAARLPAILTIPTVLFILPALFVVVLGPGMIRAFEAFSGGN